MKTGRSVMLALCLSLPGPALGSPPETPRRPVTDVYHGVSVVDDYRWLEDGSDPRVQAWSNAQNAHARAYLDSLPGRAALQARITAILETPVSSYRAPRWAGGMLFLVKNQPPRQQSFLVAMPSPFDESGARVLVDPEQIDPEAKTSIDWYEPSPDGRLVAVSLSRAGTELGDLHLYRTDSGEAVAGEVIPRVNAGTALGDVAWLPDGSGFLYTRYPRQGERPAEDMQFYQQVYFHRLGTPSEKDTYEIGREFDRIAETRLEVDPETGWILATVQQGDGGLFDLYLRSPRGVWARFAGHADQVVQGTFGPGGTLYLISRKDAPRGKILRLDVSKPDLAQARVVIPEGDDTIDSNFYSGPTMQVGGGRLYVIYQVGGPSELRAFDLDGKPADAPPQLEVAEVSDPTPLDQGAILFRMTSYLEPPAWYRFDPASGATRKTALAARAPLEFSDTEVVREWTRSRDGTRIPVNIIRRRGIALDGSHPVMLTGYGGYGLSQTPGYSALRALWVEQGGVFAEANIRGGGEFGRAWHEQGRLTQKQNCFDDFAAAMQHMIDTGYTRPERLCIIGGSNGGLLMGAMITQHPDLPHVVISSVGLYDMLRVERSPNGAFNIPEYGTVEDAEQFKALYAYSPYHRVVDGTRYPAVLFLTGANDPRVDPMQSRKMIARLQAATASDAPLLLRTSSDTGHGSGTPLQARIGQVTDYFGFALEQLGMKYAPKPPN